jgi:hypothetical protein
LIYKGRVALKTRNSEIKRLQDYRDINYEVRKYYYLKYKQVKYRRKMNEKGWLRELKRQVKTLNKELENIDASIEKQHQLAEREAIEEMAFVSEKTVLNSRDKVDDALSLCTDAIRVKNTNLTNCSTVFAGFSTCLDLYFTYKDKELDERNIRFSVDGFKLFAFITTHIIAATVNNDPSVLMIRSALIVLTMLITVLKDLYLRRVRSQQVDKESAELKRKKDLFTVNNLSNDKEREKISLYQQIITHYHSKKIIELKEKQFQSGRSVFFGCITLIGGLFMPAGVMVFAVAITGTTILAGSTVFEMIDRRMEEINPKWSNFLTKWLSSIPERIIQYLTGKKRVPEEEKELATSYADVLVKLKSIPCVTKFQSTHIPRSAMRKLVRKSKDERLSQKCSVYSGKAYFKENNDNNITKPSTEYEYKRQQPLTLISNG